MPATTPPEIMTAAGVMAALLTDLPFPSLYSAEVHIAYPGGKVSLQARDLDVTRANAERWGFTKYTYRLTADHGEFHVWTGDVNGVEVSVTATPNEPYGPLIKPFAVPAPAAALAALAAGVDR